MNSNPLGLVVEHFRQNNDRLNPGSEGTSSTLKSLQLSVPLPAALRTMRFLANSAGKRHFRGEARYAKSYFNTWWQQGTGSGRTGNQRRPALSSDKDMCAFLKEKVFRLFT